MAYICTSVMKYAVICKRRQRRIKGEGEGEGEERGGSERMTVVEWWRCEGGGGRVKGGG